MRKLADLRIRTSKKDDRGASLVEYALLIALIAVVLMGAVGFIGGSVNEGFSGATNKIDAAQIP
ncbi:MAG TPA: Flp family type IVb pilin [Microthrixaceae bacterium]|nr:Flp family type IVb pilin [Microthrixaceae bacterium]